MKKYNHYGYSDFSEPAKNLDFLGVCNLNVKGDNLVLLHHMDNFDIYPVDLPKFVFFRIIVSDRIRYNDENVQKMRDYSSKISKKKVFVFSDNEWEKITDIPQEYMICENDFFKKGWMGRRRTIRNPQELAIKPAPEYFVSFTGLEGHYVGEYPPELLKEYKAYFDRFDGVFYIFWRIEKSGIEINLERNVPLIENAIKNFSQE